VYDRTINKKELTFEASGGLINASLVMQDRETDSYWPIMRGSAVEGDLKGTELKELAINKKMKWKDWRRKHPDTLVLSVAGKEDDEPVYEKYFESDDGFRDTRASDTRLASKQPIFAFRWQGKSYAVPYQTLENGRSWALDQSQVFLYRAAGAQLHDSTSAFLAENPFAKENNEWNSTGNNCVFNADLLEFQGDQKCPQNLSGFDTFWYNWSLNNPDTQILD
jgi:hypothetical protein